MGHVWRRRNGLVYRKTHGEEREKNQVHIEENEEVGFTDPSVITQDDNKSKGVDRNRIEGPKSGDNAQRKRRNADDVEKQGADDEDIDNDNDIGGSKRLRDSGLKENDVNTNDNANNNNNSNGSDSEKKTSHKSGSAFQSYENTHKNGHQNQNHNNHNNH